jgi:hypothetical protein
MPSHFTLRMQFGPHEDPEDVAAQLRQFIADAPVDEIMFFYFAEEQNDGHETSARLRQWVERSRPYREAVQRAGVQVSLNPWHSLLHCDRSRSLKPDQAWQTMVDYQGNVATAVVCPLDETWQRYFLDSLRLYAAEGFRAVWIDDDIRYHNHAPLQWGGCFCPLHVAEFNRRAGTQATREEIVAACLAPGEPHPWRALWFDMWQETLLAFLDECRRVLADGEGVPAGTQMGLMSSAMEAHAAEGRRWADWWAAFGGGQPPVHRPHFWTYGDATGPMLIHGIAALDQNRSIQPPDLETGPEIENFPYGRWNKSFRQTFAQMAVAHVLGSTNLNISMYDFMGNRPDDEAERAAFLKRVRPNLDWLADRFPMTMRSVGVGVPWSQDMGRTIRTERGESWFELHCPSRGWAYWLGAAGVAFSARAQEGVNALSGSLAWAFDDATLKRWLASGLLLDGPAAAILVERGLDEWIGVRSCRWITQDDALYSMEECRDPAFGQRAGGQISVNSRRHTRRLLQVEPLDGVRFISNLRGPTQQIVGHGAFTFENALGGRVAVAPWDASTDTTPMMDIHRATQLRRITAWLAGSQPTGWVEGGPWLVPQFLRTGDTWRGAIWNASPDEVGTLHVHRPAGTLPLTAAWCLTPAGERLAAQVDGDTIRLAQPMHEWEVVVVE